MRSFRRRAAAIRAAILTLDEREAGETAAAPAGGWYYSLGCNLSFTITNTYQNATADERG